MRRHRLAGGEDHHLPVAGADLDLLADQLGGDRVAGRAEPHRRKPVNLAGLAAAQRRTQAR
jgi:hypothetical protein